MRKLWRFLKRGLWILIVGTCLALHNTYNQEFKSLDDVQTEIKEDEEE
ncbi:MAG: hypothetical protein AAF391_00095 [Bacteroidota bacterium]